MSVIGSVNGAA